MSERREFTRIDRSLEVDLVFGGVAIAGHSRDLSLNGLYFEPATKPLRLDPGSEVGVQVFVDGRAGQLVAKAAGRAVRIDPDGVAVHFDRLIELQSYDVLRNLIQYNAVDPAQAEREFSSHVGLKPIRR